MYTLWLFLLLGNDDNVIQHYNDSLLIYNTYKTQIQFLTEAKETDRAAWYYRESFDDSITACARRRLQLYNKSTYLPVDMVDREGMGTAYAYPKPSVAFHPGQFISDLPALKYAVIDYQTKFITDSTGATRIPYITKSYYDKGRRFYIEKLNPVTLEKL